MFPLHVACSRREEKYDHSCNQDHELERRGLNTTRNTRVRCAHLQRQNASLAGVVRRVAGCDDLVSHSENTRRKSARSRVWITSRGVACFDGFTLMLGHFALFGWRGHEQLYGLWHVPKTVREL